MGLFDGFDFLITTHAIFQRAARFEGKDVLTEDEYNDLNWRIAREVRSSFEARRFDDEKPEGIVNAPDHRSLYAWTKDGERVYAVRHDEDPPRFVVTTTFRKGVES